MYCIGKDNSGCNLQIGDICKFKIKSKEYEGMIIYDEESFAFSFEMIDNNFPSVLMKRADLYSIEKITNVTSTKMNDEYEFYRNIYNNIK